MYIAAATFVSKTGTLYPNYAFYNNSFRFISLFFNVLAQELQEPITESAQVYNTQR
jgi:hypothetical protein